jgi:hypothetical protein
MKQRLKIRSKFDGREYVVGYRSDGFLDRARIIVSEEKKVLGFKYLTELHDVNSDAHVNYMDTVSPTELVDKYYAKAIASYENKVAGLKARQVLPSYGFTLDQLIVPGFYLGVTAIIICFFMWIMGLREDRVAMEPKPVHSQVERFILVKMNPPKHFYVTLKSTVDGRVYEHAYVSKHCNEFRDNTIGDEYNIQTTTMLDPKTNTEYVRLDNLYNTFCSGK